MMFHIISIVIALLKVIHIQSPEIIKFHPIPTADEKFIPLTKSSKRSVARTKTKNKFTGKNIMGFQELNIISLKEQSCNTHHIHQQEKRKDRMRNPNRTHTCDQKGKSKLSMMTIGTVIRLRWKDAGRVDDEKEVREKENLRPG